jgi:hypothetical protein
MRRCPQCEKTYDDAAILCQYDGSPLLTITTVHDPHADTIKVSEIPDDAMRKPDDSEVQEKAPKGKSRGQRLKILKVAIPGIITLLIIIAVLGWLLITKPVTLNIVSQKLEQTTVKIPDEKGNPQDDYALKYTVQVINKGMAGKVKAIAELYTPEGQFYQEQIVSIDSGDIKTFVFIFTEPTILGTLFSEGKAQAKFRYELVK